MRRQSSVTVAVSWLFSTTFQNLLKSSWYYVIMHTDNDFATFLRGAIMDIHSIRQQLRTKSVYDISLRVTYYARVSSESDEQLNSLGNQISYYEDFIIADLIAKRVQLQLL